MYNAPFAFFLSFFLIRICINPSENHPIMFPFPVHLFLQWDFLLFVLEAVIFALLLACFLRLFRSPLSKREKHQILEFLWNLTPGKRRDYPYSDIFQSSVRASKNEIFGIELDEPFKKLECDTEERRYWLQKQQRCFQDYVDEYLKTNRSYFKSRMRKYQKGESFETPFQLNDNIYFYFKKTRRDSRHYILYCTPNVRQKGVPLLNPNVEFGNKSASIAILGTWISEDCRKLAYAFADLTCGGGVTVKVRDVESRKDSLVDTLVFPGGGTTTVSSPMGGSGSHVSIVSPRTLSVSWIHRKHKGFFYTRWVVVVDTGSADDAGDGDSDGDGGIGIRQEQGRGIPGGQGLGQGARVTKSSGETSSSSSSSNGHSRYGSGSSSSSSSGGENSKHTTNNSLPSLSRGSSSVVSAVQEVCFHRLNSPQHTDLVVFRGARSTHSHALTVSQDDRSVVRQSVSQSVSTRKLR